MELDSPALTGLIAATYTPFSPGGRVEPDRVPEIVEFQISRGISGLYVNGTTGEGPSLTSAERKSLAEAFIRAAAGRLPVVVQVGHNSLNEANELARHAEDSGAAAISATPPGYFRAESVETLVDCLVEITAGTSAPFYYYHIPAFGGVSLDMSELLRAANPRVPSLRGIKFSSTQLHELVRCRRAENGKFDILFGVDEMLLSGLVTGVKGAVGSTYNWAPRLYLEIIEAFELGDLTKARELQAASVDLIAALIECCGRSGLKAMMKIAGVDCGPHRLPIKDPTPENLAALEKRLDHENLRQWLG